MTFHDFTITLAGDVRSRRTHDTRSLVPEAVAVFAGMLAGGGAAFHLPIPAGGFERISLRFTAEGDGAATATFYSGGAMLSHSALASGRDPDGDRRHLSGLQQVIVTGLRGTPLEPGFGPAAITERPALVTLAFPPPHPDHPLVADMETCLAAAFFLAASPKP